jgi:peptidoglycan/xylan/chitin deacetylase (PgdA/CDA1 family)
MKPTKNILNKVARKAWHYFDRPRRSFLVRAFPPRPRPLILMYHSIADEPIDPSGLAVSPAHFKEQLDILRQSRRLLPLTDFVRGLHDRKLPENAVALTFDDGYADNLHASKPILAAADVPATVFLATGFIGRADEFWWDELARLILATPGRWTLQIMIRGGSVLFDLDENALAPGDRWRAWCDPPSTVRQTVYLTLWNALCSLEPEEREISLKQIRKALGDAPVRPGTRRPMTYDEVRELASDRLITIGAHTVSHPRLTELDEPARRREIAASRHFCEKIAGAEISTFSYPFGILDTDVRAIVAEAGFACACSSNDGPATFRSDVYALPRIQVTNIGGDKFERLLHYASASD